MIPIDNVILDAPDCCGKTTLYSSLHKATGFKYNIQDRSNLSMLCYAHHYGRDPRPHMEALMRELNDVNNVYVVPLMSLDVVLNRLAWRGDEFQDGESLTRLHGIFTQEVSRISSLPNVFVLRTEMPKEDTASLVKELLAGYETMAPRMLGSHLSRWAHTSLTKEVQFHARFYVHPDTFDDSILYDQREGEYYRTIMKGVRETIGDELAGRNPYGVPQTLDSRRFFYSSSTCISSIHFVPRGDVTKVIVGLRSTDAERNGEVDLRFLTMLSAQIPREFAWGTHRIELDVTFNSLHIREDLHVDHAQT